MEKALAEQIMYYALLMLRIKQFSPRVSTSWTRLQPSERNLQASSVNKMLEMFTIRRQLEEYIGILINLYILRFIPAKTVFKAIFSEVRLFLTNLLCVVLFVDDPMREKQM